MLLNQRTWRRSSVVLNFDVAPRPPRCRVVQQTRVQTTPGYLPPSYLFSTSWCALDAVKKMSSQLHKLLHRLEKVDWADLHPPAVCISSPLLQVAKRDKLIKARLSIPATARTNGLTLMSA
jgi:hypothetical protein